MASTDILKLDLYGILDITKDATDKEIVKAYRKKALKCHPDKNPDNPKAVELFHELSKALEILTDPAAKAAYDKHLAAKAAAAARHKELDGKRKKFKEDLEARESAAAQQQATDAKSKSDLQREIERLRKEGSRLLEEEKARLAEELKRQKAEQKTETKPTAEPARLKVRWKASKTEPGNGGYDSERLKTLFSKYGEVTAVIVSAKKAGSALVEFASGYDAALAVQNEVGNPNVPLSFTWLSGKPASMPAPPRENAAAPGDNGRHQTGPAKQTATPLFPAAGISSYSYQAPSSDNRDFESIVLMKMRQAEERKRLIEQMQKDDDEEEKT